MKIKLKAPLIVIVFALLTSTVSGYASYASNRRLVEIAKKHELRTTATLIQTSLTEEANKAMADPIVSITRERTFVDAKPGGLEVRRPQQALGTELGYS